MANLKDSQQSTVTPVLTDKVRGLDDPAGTPATVTFLLSAIKDLFKTSYDALYMAIVAPGTSGNVLVSNGSAWTSAAPKMLLPFGIYLDFNPFSATDKYPYAATIDRNLTLVKWSMGATAGATNNGSNYWDIKLYEWASDTLLATLTTSGSTAAVHTVLSTTTFADSTMTAANKGLYIKVVKVGTPGNLYLAGPLLEVTG